MYILIGLGNIGHEYEFTRHNFGFLLFDEIIHSHSFRYFGKKFRSEVFSGEISGKKIIALKPHTFMNLAGHAASEAMNFYKIDPKNILVFHDDVDLALGKIKIKIGGGNAGHNGLKSLDELIGKNYMRLRLGIGRPENREFAIADYVLGKFSKDELMEVERINKKISQLIDELLAGRWDMFLNKFYL